jgi:hypothetical protein
VTRGVNSPKRGRNSGGGLNSDGGNGAPVAQRRHEDEGERGGVLARPLKERMGGEKGHSGNEAALLYRCGVEGVRAGSGRCHAARRWGRAPVRPVGGGRLTTARPQC